MVALPKAYDQYSPGWRVLIRNSLLSPLIRETGVYSSIVMIDRPTSTVWRPTLLYFSSSAMRDATSFGGNISEISTPGYSSSGVGSSSGSQSDGAVCTWTGTEDAIIALDIEVPFWGSIVEASEQLKKRQESDRVMRPVILMAEF